MAVSRYQPFQETRVLLEFFFAHLERDGVYDALALLPRADDQCL